MKHSGVVYNILSHARPTLSQGLYMNYSSLMFIFIRINYAGRNSPPYYGLRGWVSGPYWASGFLGDPTFLAHDNIEYSGYLRGNNNY